MHGRLTLYYIYYLSCRPRSSPLSAYMGVDQWSEAELLKGIYCLAKDHAGTDLVLLQRLQNKLFTSRDLRALQASICFQKPRLQKVLPNLRLEPYRSRAKLRLPVLSGERQRQRDKERKRERERGEIRRETESKRKRVIY